MKAFLVAIASDVHMPHHHVQAWGAFRKWHADHRPTLTVLNGDVFDMAQTSSFELDPAEAKSVIPAMRDAITEINAIAGEARRVILLDGNHESARWDRTVVPAKKQALDGAIGLTFFEQLRAQGLSKKVELFREGLDNPGIMVARTNLLIRHGHRQAGRFGAKYIADKHLRETPRHSTVVGHHHRAQIMCRTSLDKGKASTVVSMSLPCLTKFHDYAGPGADWQKGFGVVEVYGAKKFDYCDKFTPRIVIMDDDGSFAWGGKVYR